MNILADPHTSGSNPYINILYENLRNLGVGVEPFTLRQSLYAKAQVCHLHWPEAVLNKEAFFIRVDMMMRLFCKLMIAKLRRMRIVWTVHNVAPHEKYSGQQFQHFFYRTLDWFIDGKIFLSHSSEREYTQRTRCRKPHVVIHHGDYSVYYADFKPDENIIETIAARDFPRGRVFGHYGLIRPYKNTLGLIRAFRKSACIYSRLIIAGKIIATEQSHHESIIEAIGSDSRISYIPRFISESEMLALVGITDLIVLPYSNIHNSGVALLALSLGARVLVPAAPTMLELRDDVGSQCVHILDPEVPLGEQMMSITSEQSLPPPVPNLELYCWETIAQKTLDFYQALCT